MIRTCILFLTLASPALANPLERDWCRGQEILVIDADGIKINEHTICDVENLPVVMNSADSWTSPVACRGVWFPHVDLDGPIVGWEYSVEDLTQLTLLGAADGTLVLTTNREGDETQYLPCEE